MKKMKRLTALLVGVMVLLMPLSAFASAKKDVKTIGFSVYDMQYEFFQSMEAGTKEAVEELGYKYILHDQKSDETQMVTGAINLIDQGVAALIISPCKPEALSSIVEAAKAKKVPVIVDDIGGGGTNYDAIVISDCYEGGQQAADYTVELLKGKEGSKKVAIIKCEPSAVYAIRRGEGYKANITAAGFKVVKELSGHSKSDEGYTIMQDLLASDSDIVAVFAENDPMAVGAANALADAGRDDIAVIGFNGDGEALDAMEAGLMQGTVAQDPYGMGKLTVELADKLIKKEKLTYDNKDTREIFAAVKLITEVKDGKPVFASADNSGKTIGFSVYDMQYEFFQSMEAGTKDAIEKLGYKYVLHDQKSDETQMVTGAINLIDQGVAALIISPCKPEALSSIVEAAKAKKVPVIVDDIGGGGTDYDAIVISDCYEGGQQAADYTIELLKGTKGSKKVAIIKCEPSAVYAIRRGEGYKANITAAGYKVVKELSGHSKSDEGYTIMQDLLASNPDIVAVFAENDPMAVGAANALADAGRDDIIVIGFNGDGEAIDAMDAGLMQGTVAQDPYGMGKLTVELADKLINGKALTYDDAATREIFAEVNLIKAE